MAVESECRKECFDERHSAPVVLADGQTWHLPKPWLEIRPVFRGGRAEASYPVLTYGPELDRFVEVIADEDDWTIQLCLVASLGAHLLNRQYELTDADLDGLFCVRVSQPESGDWVKSVMEVATGRSGPKASSAGGG
jgi:hypothetical protein